MRKMFCLWYNIAVDVDKLFVKGEFYGGQQ